MTLTVEQLDDMEAEIREAIDRVRTIITVAPTSERRRLERKVGADSMRSEGWVRFPGTRIWRQIVSITGPRPGDAPVQRYISWRNGGDIITRHVNAHDELHYLSDADFNDSCEREQAMGADLYHRNVHRLRAELSELNGDDAA
jgi:hypothetical protein